MAKKQNITTTLAPPVTYRNGKWITADGLSYNTEAKAEKHVKELELETKKTNDNGTIE